MTEHMLTTIDNPFNPFTHYDEWWAFDTGAGYHTASFLARIVKTSDELSETDQSLAIEMAIDEIVSENVLGLYKKVEEPVVDSTLKQSDDYSVRKHDNNIESVTVKRTSNKEVEVLRKIYYDLPRIIQE